MRQTVLRVTLTCVLLALPLALVPIAFATAKSKLPVKAKTTRPNAISDDQLKQLTELDKNYQKQSSAMNVTKVTKIPLLEQERKSSGKLWIATGKLRMEMNGEEKTLLVVNKKDLWAVTYPDPAFKDAAVQVIRADTSTKKGRSQSFLTLLSQGGFLKFFMATGAEKDDGGNVLYYLTPKQEQVDFKRAQVKVSADGKHLIMMSYWDDRDNETRMDFTDVKLGEKIDPKIFDFTPPANADVQRL